ncbi:gas2 domain-containing protein [Apiospora kogelbergensis]|uniref:Gas2 domain-containing protein n=1 Tax=Apiospora kogelbergensis TaxID=1337665 RepID=A0AAW0QAW1_9PEZI
MSDSRAIPSMATPPPAGRGAMRRPLRSTSRSPTRHRISDNLLARLSPMSAVEALRSPEGALKACLDNATASEQSFTMRTAVASRKIHDWVDELSAWPWPTASSSAGFEMPSSKRRKVSDPFESSEDQQLREPADHPEPDYMGSLPAEDVVAYEGRTELIHRELAALDVEEIKMHVLHNHIMPLSRPGTPFSDAGLSLTSTLSFTKMEDLSAVITAITVQALPNLAKLSRLLNTWGIRLVVLRKVPIVLSLISEAEVAIAAGWNAIEVGGSTPPPEDSTTGTPAGKIRLPLPRKDYEVMNQVLQKKVASPGRDLDFMLDTLEGSEDTLPNEWLDRLEEVEKDYAEWAITAERRVQEGEWDPPSKPAAEQPELVISETPQPTIEIQLPSPVEASTPFDHSLFATLSNSPDSRGSPSRRIASTDGQQELFLDEDDFAEDTAFDYDGMDDSYVVPTKSLPIISKTDASDPMDSQIYDDEESYASTQQGVPDTQAPQQLAPPAHIARMAPELDTEFSYLESVLEEDEEGEEPKLPPPRFAPRKISQESMRSYRSRGRSREASVEPEFGRLPDPDEPLSDALSPPSSPPLRYRGHSNSVSFQEQRDLSPDNVTPPKSPLESGVFDIESSFDHSQMHTPGYTTPGHSVPSNEYDLHRQIRGVLKSLPNQIRFTRREATVELNPPDLNLPSRPKLKLSDPVARRSGSAMSTMSMNSRDAQTYFLSRSSGEAPMKLLIRSVGESGERVMVRVGGGWADLGEYLKEYAIHHGRRSQGEGKVEVKDSATSGRDAKSSPPSRPGTAHDSPMTPLAVRKTRRSLVGETRPSGNSLQPPQTPLSAMTKDAETPDTGASGRSASSTEADNSVLGLSGPRPKKADDRLTEESRAWVEDVTSKVRSASGDHRMLGSSASEAQDKKGKFGELGKVGGTKRVFRKAQ